MKLCAAAVLLVMACAAPTAGAAEVKQRDRAGDVRSAALDIATVTARADTAGLAVDVRLRGDFERQAGSGALRSAVAGIELRRKRGRAGSLVSSGPDRRARVRSQRVGGGPVAVVRDGRTIRFRVAGDVSAVTSVRVRVAAAQASDAATVKLDHRSSSGDAACRDLVRARSDLALRLGSVGRALARGAAANRRKRLRQERTGVEEYLFAIGRKLGLGCPGVAPLAADPADPNANQSPFASFTVSPPGPGYKAGQTLTFEARGTRDPDGTIAQYVWSDGVPPHVVANGFEMTRWYGAPGTYTIRLTVTDDGGAMTFTSKTFFVGGRGTKPLRNPDNSMVRIDCPASGASPRAGVAEILVPSYAVDPTASTPNPCPDAGLDTTVTLVKGNATGAMDEWSRPRDTLRIAYRFDHAGPGAGNQNVALDWSATWK
jgi:hypothetical protein